VYADTEPERSVDPAFDVIVMGHTHRPFALVTDERLLLNVGSVGLPRDVGNLASFAVLDSESGGAAIYRVRFDVAEVLERWGHEIHAQTAACLTRTTEHFEGERIA
jgi:diadenosine tetraphosphatase ApaH/serine/threonine PP2A family protein phosphatase